MRTGRLALINVLGLVIIILIGAIAFYIWHQGYYFYSTNDAVVSGQSVNVASLQPGIITRVEAAQGQTVRRGATVFSLLAAPGGASGSASGNGNSSSRNGPSSGNGSVTAPGGSNNSSNASNSNSGGNGSRTTSSSASSRTTSAAQSDSVRVSAPIAGTIIDQLAQPGQAVQPGQPLAQIVDLSRVYVTAYVDEGRIKDVRKGQGVDVSVDAISDVSFHGTVSQVVPATQATFSLIPTNNYGSGNFTKVTQRIPVLIQLDSLEGQTLPPGASANVTIHLHE